MSGWAWTAVDPVAMSDRPNLDPSDACFYYMTRDSRGFMASRANDLMNDFKKDVRRYAGRPDVMAYKDAAISECAGYVSEFFEDREGLFRGTPVSIVPIPTSVPRGAEMRDYRLDRLCEFVSERVPWVRFEPSLDIVAEMRPSHVGGTRDVDELERVFRLLSPIGAGEYGGWVVLFDDILTTGAHYAACRNIVRRAYPNSASYSIVGLFLALHTWV